eukprot:1071812-Pelagomonas_calceolata.AAC.6
MKIKLFSLTMGKASNHCCDIHEAFDRLPSQPGQCLFTCVTLFAKLSVHSLIYRRYDRKQPVKQEQAWPALLSVVRGTGCTGAWWVGQRSYPTHSTHKSKFIKHCMLPQPDVGVCCWGADTRTIRSKPGL